MEIKSEPKLGTLVPWMTTLLRDVLLISVSSYGLRPHSLCIRTNQPRKGERFGWDSFLPQRAMCQYVLLLWKCSVFQSPDAPRLVNCLTCIIRKISGPGAGRRLLNALQGKEATDSVPCLETPLSLNKDHH